MIMLELMQDLTVFRVQEKEQHPRSSNIGQLSYPMIAVAGDTLVPRVNPLTPQRTLSIGLAVPNGHSVDTAAPVPIRI